MAERVSRAEAARRLGINRSTLSRWVKKHPALLDEANTVDIDQLRKHRDTVINPKLQTRTAKSEPAEATLNDHRSRREHAMAAEAELSLAEKLGLTLRRDQVEAALADAAEVMKSTASQMCRDKAEALTLIDDQRAMEKALVEMMRELMEKTENALMQAASDGSTDTAVA